MAATQSARSGDAQDQSHSPHGAGMRDSESTTVHLPFVTAQFRLPAVRVPGREDLAHAGTRARGWLPPAEQLAYYGSLGALAAFSVIDWPVAAAIGAGTLVAQSARARADSTQSQSSRTGA